MRRALACVMLLGLAALALTGCGRIVSSPASDPATGTLDVGDIGAALRLDADTGKVELGEQGGRWSLPAGAYRVQSITLARKDKDGNDWYVFGSAKDIPVGEFQIVAAQVTRLKLGPPISVGAEVAVKDGEAGISLRLTGQGGERYCAAMVMNENLKGAPNIRITNELGEELDSGQFRYG